MKETQVGTDTKEFTLIAEVQIWRNKDGSRWDLWIGNALYHYLSLSEVMSRLGMYLNTK